MRQVWDMAKMTKRTSQVLDNACLVDQGVMPANYMALHVQCSAHLWPQASQSIHVGTRNSLLA